MIIASDGFVVDDGAWAEQALAAKSLFWVVAETVGFALGSRECFIFQWELTDALSAKTTAATELLSSHHSSDDLLASTISLGGKILVGELPSTVAGRDIATRERA